MADENTLARLTARQRAVLDLLDLGAPTKVIARRLYISETRVNQLVRGCKELLGASSRYALVQRYRTLHADDGSLPTDAGAPVPPPFHDPAYRNSELPHLAAPAHGPGGETAAVADVPRIVPAALDRGQTGLRRVAALISVAALLCATMILLLTTHRVLAETFDHGRGRPLAKPPFVACEGGGQKDGVWQAAERRTGGQCCLSGANLTRDSRLDPVAADPAIPVAGGACVDSGGGGVGPRA